MITLTLISSYTPKHLNLFQSSSLITPKTPLLNTSKSSTHLNANNNSNHPHNYPPTQNTHFPILSTPQQTTFLTPHLLLLDTYSYHLIFNLKSCTSIKELKRLHTIAIKCFQCIDTYVSNNLISSYVRLGRLFEARKVFDEMTEKNVVSWTALLNGFLRFGLVDEAFGFLKEFLGSGVPPNFKTFVCVLDLCARRLDYELGRQVHACYLKSGLSNLRLGSAVVHFYAECGDMLGATCAFHVMPDHDVVSWTTIITACSRNERTEEAFSLFSRMLSEGFCPNEFTVCSVLKACGYNGALMYGKPLHAIVVKNQFISDVFIGTILVDMYAKNEEIKESRKVFDRMRKRNMVTWTSIIAGYARNGLCDEAISLFRTMKRRNISANNLTMVSMLKACGSGRFLSLGKEIHAQLIKNHNESSVYIGSALIWLYFKCGEHSVAYKILQQMLCKDVVSWTAMISGCNGLGHEYEALEFLKEMLGKGVEPNPFTYSSALKACARLENINQGRLIHSSVNKTPAFFNVYVGSSLIVMYSKCGSVPDAVQVFNSMREKNFVSWKAMIVCYAKNGMCQEALRLMYRMQDEGVEVDDYIRATVLTSCGDNGTG